MHTGTMPWQIEPCERQTIVGGATLSSMSPLQSLSRPSQISTPPLVFWQYA